MATDWVVVELSPQGESEDPDVLLASLKRSLKKEVEIFIPASVSIVAESRVVHRLIDNYVFVRYTLPDQAYLRLEGTKYVSTILTINRGSTRSINGIKDADVTKMRRQIHVETEQGINVGDEVRIESGPYKGIHGRIIGDIPENDAVQVFIKLRSKEAIVTFPRSFLRFVAKGIDNAAAFNPFLTKITRIQDWAAKVRPLLSWSDQGWPRIQRQGQVYDRITHWIDRGRQLFEANRDPFAAMAQRLNNLQLMDRMVAKAPGLFELIGVERGLIRHVSAKAVEQKAMQVGYLNDVASRLADLEESVNYMETAVVDVQSSMIQNVVVDGHNLAYRIHYALAAMAKPMVNAEGKTVSLIYGMTKSLAALRKRFPKANLYVVWDGSPQRRMKQFGEYKAGRKSVLDKEQVAQIQALLPLVGVRQVHNPEEETDDILAGLVKNNLKGQRNLILSNDKDFLQLVTYTDMLLVPKVGNRPETLYDPDKVVADYGVTPDRIVALRAFQGDTSDNIPGVSRVPTKILTALVNTFGTVSDVYASNMSGLTTGQFERLSASEAQVRQNVHLMTLLKDLPFEETPENKSESSAVEILGALGINADIISPFFEASAAPAQGFVKT